MRNSLKYEQFDKVSFIEASGDRISAFIHAVMGLHKTCNPFEVYYKKLLSYIASRQTRARLSINTKQSENDKRQKAYSNMSEEFITIEIASMDHDIAAKEREVEEAKTTKRYCEDEYSTELHKVKNRYEGWYEILGRPPYYDIFDYRKLFGVSGNTNTETGSDDTRKIFSFFKRIGSWIKKHILNGTIVIVCSAEVYFVFPAFAFITPNDMHAAAAGAVILVGALYGLGYFSGFFFIRSRINTIICDAQSEGKPKKINVAINWANSILFVLAIMASVAVVLGGTALRTMIYDAERNETEINRMVETKKFVNSSREAAIKINISDNDLKKINDELKGIDNDLSELRQKQINLRKQPIIPNTSDGYMALAIYLTLYLFSFYSRLLLEDPYFEYGLIARERFALELEKNLREHTKLANIENRQHELDHLKKEQSELKKAKDGNAAKEEQHLKSNAETIDDSKIGAFNKISEEWLKQRMLNYFTVYMLLRGKKIRENYGETAEKAYIR